MYEIIIKNEITKRKNDSTALQRVVNFPLRTGERTASVLNFIKRTKSLKRTRTRAEQLANQQTEHSRTSSTFWEYNIFFSVDWISKWKFTRYLTNSYFKIWNLNFEIKFLISKSYKFLNFLPRSWNGNNMKFSAPVHNIQSCIYIYNYVFVFKCEHLQGIELF